MFIGINMCYMFISIMDEEGSQAKARILAHYTNVVATFEGEDAWKNVLESRYQPGAPRARVKRMYRDYRQILNLRTPVLKFSIFGNDVKY